MSEAVVVRLGDEGDWQDFDIPGSNMPARVVTLRVERPSRARVLLVRFPSGFERAITGRYEAAEELVVIEGGLEMSGAAYEAGDWAWIPAGATRRATRAAPEMLSLARFDGPARWHEGAGPAEPPASRARLDAGTFADPSPLGRGWGVLLRDGEPSSWLVDAPEPGAAASIDAELYAIGSRTWVWAPAGTPFPALEGRCFCRTFSAGGSP